MKKIISLVLMLSVIVCAMSALTSCKKKIKGGAEAAKLLLANERLDESIVSAPIDIGLTANGRSASLSSAMSAVVRFNQAAYYGSESKHTWSSFPAHNDTASQFDSFFINIESQASRSAESIEMMKQNIAVVDKWVELGNVRRMLRVYDDTDVLISIEDDYLLDVCYRYTDENANNVYEMYQIYEIDGSSAEIRTLYIPGSRYESHYIYGGGFEDYVIMENSRGYWVGTRYGYGTTETGAGFVNATQIVVKDDFCYSANININGDYNDGLPVVSSYAIVDLKSGSELINLSFNDDHCNFTLGASGIASGLVSLGADESYVIEGLTETGSVNKLVTANGVYTPNDFQDGKPNGFVGGSVSYDHALGIPRGYINMLCAYEGSGIEAAFDAVVGVLDKYGLTLRRSNDEIYSQLLHASELGEDFDEVFEWNGYLINGIENFELARDALRADYASARADYEAVKDFPVSDERQKLAASVDFARLELIGAEANSYADGIVTIGGVTVELGDDELLESGRDYALVVALSLVDEDGNPISVNTVALDGTTPTAVGYSGGKLALGAAGSYNIPKNLTEGDYALVVYAASADDGIRVSDMLKLGSFSTYSEKLESAAMDITVSSAADTLHFSYAIKNSYTVEIISGGKQYTDEEIEHIIKIEVLKKGAPFVGAVLEYADGTAVGDSSTLGVGSYRMMCFLYTADGPAQSYIYLNVK